MTVDGTANNSRWRCAVWMAVVSAGVVAASGSIVVVGNQLGQIPRNGEPAQSSLEAWASFDGSVFRRLADEGYTYDPDEASDVAFFPLYPLLGRGVRSVTGLSTVAALLVVSHAALWAAFAAFLTYVAGRNPDTPAVATSRQYVSVPTEDWQWFALAAMALWPTTFFLRMAYSESVFLLTLLLSMLAMQRRWPLLVTAALIGLATAARHLGVALLAPLVWHVFEQAPVRRQALAKLAWAMPLACWGLIAFMAFQQIEFGDALAFAKTQDHWRMRQPAGLAEKILALASWQPIWGVYDPSEPGHWGTMGSSNPLFNLSFANPIYFVAAALLTGFGAWKRWLNVPEVLLAVSLLAMAYVARGFEMCMCSQGRFAAVVFPTYLVLGRILAAMPLAIAMTIFGLMGAMLALYSALFAAGYSFI